MDDFQLKPARDLGLSPYQRSLSLQRESGLVETGTHITWWLLIRIYLRLYHRMSITGREHIPSDPPFVMIANHASHLDAMMLAAFLPMRYRDCIFPVAAGDTFFQTPATAGFATTCLNALPMWRHNCGRHALEELRQRLVDEPCIYVLFPEGSRSRDGRLQPFRSGLGMIVAGTTVPVVPCFLDGPHQAMPPHARLPRPRRLRLHIGQSLTFPNQPNRRAGWDHIASVTRQAVIDLSKQAGTALREVCEGLNDASQG